MRERLALYFGQTQCFTAQFQCYGRTAEGSNVVLLVRVQIEDRWVCDHLWIHRSKMLKNLALEKGDIVEFMARVGRYARNEPIQHVSEIQWDYNLEKIHAVNVIQRRYERHS